LLNYRKNQQSHPDLVQLRQEEVLAQVLPGTLAMQTLVKLNISLSLKKDGILRIQGGEGILGVIQQFLINK
jgi:hypothetical protein